MTPRRVYAVALTIFALSAVYFLFAVQMCGWTLGPDLQWIEWIFVRADARNLTLITAFLRQPSQLAWGYLSLSAAYLGLVFAVGRSAPLKPRTIFLLAAVVCAALILTWRVQSTDVYDYLVRGRILTMHHCNPYTVTPHAFKNDPYFPLCHWENIVWVYGPVWLFFVSLATAIPNAAGAVIFLRALTAASHLTNGWLIWKILGDGDPVRRARATVLYLFCPLALAESAVNGHCDSVAVTFILVGFLLDQRGRRPWAAAALMGAAMVKIYAGPILLFYFLANVRHGTAPERRRAALEILIPPAILTVMFYLPFVHTRAALFAPFSGGSSSTVVQSWGKIPFIQRWLTYRQIISMGLRITVLGLYGGIISTWKDGDWRQAGGWFFFIWCAFGATWFQPWYPIMALAPALAAGCFRLRLPCTVLALLAPVTYFSGCMAEPPWVGPLGAAVTPWIQVIAVTSFLAVAAGTRFKKSA